MINNKSLYVLNAIHPKIARDGKKGHYDTDVNGSVKSYIERIGVFSSIKNAEKAIKTLVKQEENSAFKRWYPEYFGFILDEIYLDNSLYGENNWKNISHFETRRSYLFDGSFNCMTEMDNRYEKKFRGRRTPITKIKPGDIAFMWYGDSIDPILIGENPMTKKEWKSRMHKNCCGDLFDDSGIVFTVDNGHEHPISPNVFPISCLPFYKLSKRNLKKMEKLRDGYYDGTML